MTFNMIIGCSDHNTLQNYCDHYFLMDGNQSNLFIFHIHGIWGHLFQFLVFQWHHYLRFRPKIWTNVGIFIEQNKNVLWI